MNKHAGIINTVDKANKVREIRKRNDDEYRRDGREIPRANSRTPKDRSKGGHENDHAGEVYDVNREHSLVEDIYVDVVDK